MLVKNDPKVPNKPVELVASVTISVIVQPACGLSCYETTGFYMRQNKNKG